MSEDQCLGHSISSGVAIRLHMQIAGKSARYDLHEATRNPTASWQLITQAGPRFELLAASPHHFNLILVLILILATNTIAPLSQACASAPNP